MEYGQNPDGSPIGSYRSAEYEMFKRQLNPLAGGKVDLILTGETKRKLRIKAVGSGQFELYSTDMKWDGLVGKYGKQIKGVSDKWFAEQQRTNHAPKLIERMKTISGIT